jgi:hypothetical protein
MPNGTFLELKNVGEKVWRPCGVGVYPPPDLVDGRSLRYMGPHSPLFPETVVAGNSNLVAKHCRSDFTSC